MGGFGARAATFGLVLALVAALPGWAQPAKARWVGAWAASQQIPETRNEAPAADLTDATVRQVIRLTVGGPRLRVRLSNAFGTAPLTFSAVRVARPVALGAARIDPATDRAVTFNGLAGVTVPAGADYLSDPVELPVAALSSLAVSFHLPQAPAVQTSHPGSRTTSYFARGDQVSAADLPDARTIVHWYQLSGVDVPATSKSAAIVTLGDSITDGSGTGPDRNDRWPDVLADRLQGSPATRHLSVLNHGIGGNRVLLDGLGPNVLARFDRDVLAQTGVRYLVLLEGVNDLGTLTRDAPATPEAHAALVRRMIGAYQQVVARARQHGIKAIGGTITPYGASPYYHPDARNEADRQAINRWIRAPGNFDAVIDFDAAIRDPARPERMAAAYDSGDGLHPSLAGYRRMAESVPLDLFK
ncbi:MAG: SGNH/GDSL hydrolase family protein [Phenylobacterium sp.]